MGFLDWFDASGVESFAKDISARLIVLSQRSSAVAGAGSKKVRKVLDGFDSVLLEVENFAARNPMNIYKKAKFLNAVKWALEDGDCAEEFIGKAISALSVSINKR